MTVADDAGRSPADPIDSRAQIKSFGSAVGKAEELGKRLPTEAEYEYLATNGGTTKYPWGDDWPAAAATIVADDQGDAFGPVGTPEFDKVAKYPTVAGLCSNKAEWVMPQLLPELLETAVRRSLSLKTARIYRGGRRRHDRGGSPGDPRGPRPAAAGRSDREVDIPRFGVPLRAERRAAGELRRVRVSGAHRSPSPTRQRG